MYGLYVEGSTLEEVGKRFHLSRQRILQIFQERDLPTRSAIETRAVRRARIIRERSAEVHAACEELKDVDAVARKLKIPKALVKEIVRQSFPGGTLPRPAPRPRRPRYSDRELLAILSKANAATSQRLSAGVYERYAKGRRLRGGRPWPSAQTVAKRFGTWRNALAKAGL